MSTTLSPGDVKWTALDAGATCLVRNAGSDDEWFVGYGVRDAKPNGRGYVGTGGQWEPITTSKVTEVLRSLPKGDAQVLVWRPGYGPDASGDSKVHLSPPLSLPGVCEPSLTRRHRLLALL